MSGTVPLWQFGNRVDGNRARTLLTYSSFDAIAAVLEHATVKDFMWEAFNGRSLPGCYRATFLLQVSKSAYDAFFNSPVGYRGQFARSVAAGEEANRRLLKQLEAVLLAYAESSSTVPQSLIKTSLSAAQAKVWICETEVEAQLGSTEPAIIYEPWEHASVDGVGLLAPVGEQLEIKGGWLARNGEERFNLGKSSRSEDIHRTGFS